VQYLIILIKLEVPESKVLNLRTSNMRDRRPIRKLYSGARIVFRARSKDRTGVFCSKRRLEQ